MTRQHPSSSKLRLLRRCVLHVRLFRSSYASPVHANMQCEHVVTVSRVCGIALVSLMFDVYCRSSKLRFLEDRVRCIVICFCSSSSNRTGCVLCRRQRAPRSRLVHEFAPRFIPRRGSPELCHMFIPTANASRINVVRSPCNRISLKTVEPKNVSLTTGLQYRGCVFTECRFDSNSKSDAFIFARKADTRSSFRTLRIPSTKCTTYVHAVTMLLSVLRTFCQVAQHWRRY